MAKRAREEMWQGMERGPRTDRHYAKKQKLKKAGKQRR
jgi:hypothetical protein